MPAWTISAVTHRGCVRTLNEDSIAIDRRLLKSVAGRPFSTSITSDQLYVMIADGMGGHAKGEVASRAALETLSKLLLGSESPDLLISAINQANHAIFDMMDRDPLSIGMGTTLVGVQLQHDKLIVFNVGDSRAYLGHSCKLIQLSTDDVPDLVLDASFRRPHVITQCLGGLAFRTDIVAHVMSIPALKGNETLLLCSDGLTDILSDDVILDVLTANLSMEDCIIAILDMVLAAGGDDNVSVIIVRSNDDSRPRRRSPTSLDATNGL